MYIHNIEQDLQIQLYGQWLCVVVEVVGVCGAAVGAVVVHHDGAGVTAVQPPLGLALLAAPLPLLVERAVARHAGTSRTWPPR